MKNKQLHQVPIFNIKFPLKTYFNLNWLIDNKCKLKKKKNLSYKTN